MLIQIRSVLIFSYFFLFLTRVSFIFVRLAFHFVEATRCLLTAQLLEILWRLPGLSHVLVFTFSILCLDGKE